MITASFFKKNGKIQKFSVSGHSGYSEQGSDIVCAAVSSMVMLTVNVITEDLGVPCSLKVKEESALIELALGDENDFAHILLSGLERELSNLTSDYPENVRVIVK
jgi:uncharacterized protein YsxB (DUF464 family)